MQSKEKEKPKDWANLSPLEAIRILAKQNLDILTSINDLSKQYIKLAQIVAYISKAMQLFIKQGKVLNAEELDSAFIQSIKEASASEPSKPSEGTGTVPTSAGDEQSKLLDSEGQRTTLGSFFKSQPKGEA